jgi:putrescine transport system permease protein
VTGPGSSTLPMVIYSKVKLGVSPDMNALASLVILFVSIGVACAGWLMHRAEQQRLADVKLAQAQPF